MIVICKFSFFRSSFFFFNDTATTEIYTLSLHDALPIIHTCESNYTGCWSWLVNPVSQVSRSEEHTSELQSQVHLVCRLLLEKKKNQLHNPSNQYLIKHNKKNNKTQKIR